MIILVFVGGVVELGLGDGVFSMRDDTFLFEKQDVAVDELLIIVINSFKEASFECVAELALACCVIFGNELLSILFLLDVLDFFFGLTLLAMAGNTND